MGDKVEMSQINVNKNQILSVANEEGRMKDALRTNSSYCVCLKCQHAGLTTVERTWNWVNCLYACFCSPCWQLSKLCKAKDLNCMDAKHTCAKCGGHFVDYQAC